MRVALVGNVSQRPFENNLSGIVRAFAALSDLRVVEPIAFPGYEPTGGASPSRVPYEAVAAVSDGFAPDAVVCLGGGLYLEQESRALLPASTVLVGIAASDPVGLAASFQIAPTFDLFFTQAPSAVPAYRARRLVVDRLDPAVDPEQYFPVNVPEVCDVLYVGKWTPYREEMIAALARDLRVRVHGYSWESRWRVPTQPTLDTPALLREALCGARVALECALVDEPAAGEQQWTARITNRPQMAAACGIPSLSERFEHLQEFFRPGVEIETYGGAEELVAKARGLVDDEPRRRRMGALARARVLRDHTWKGRIAGLLRKVEVARRERR